MRPAAPLKGCRGQASLMPAGSFQPAAKYKPGAPKNQTRALKKGRNGPENVQNKAKMNKNASKQLKNQKTAREKGGFFKLKLKRI